MKDIQKKLILSSILVCGIPTLYADNVKSEISNVEILEKYNKVEATTQELFILGINAKNVGKLDESEKYFKELLLKDPNASRVKLELAEISFALGKKEATKKLLNEVKLTNPPAKVGANIDSFLAFIAQNEPKEWSSYGKLGFFYDSNANQGPNIDTILMYNLPFTLDSNAKGQSDIALTFGAGVNHNKIITDNMAWQSGLHINLTNYEDINSYDASTLSLSSGPSWKKGLVSYSLPLIVSGVKIGHEERYYSLSGGIAPQVSYQASQKLNLNSSLALQTKHYHNNSDRDSESITFSPSARYSIDNNSYVSGGGYLGRESSDTTSTSNNSNGINLNYVNSFKKDWVGYLGASKNSTKYDGIQTAFGKAREDDYTSTYATLSYDLRKYDSVLEVSFNHGKNSSSIDMYDFTRNQTSVTLTKKF